MSVRENITQAVRNWAIFVNSLDDDQVIKANQKGPRPALPYLTVLVGAHGSPQTIRDEVLRGVDGGGLPTKWLRRIQRDTVSIQGYGVSSNAWLEALCRTLEQQDVIDELATLGITPRGSLGPVLDVSTLLDTEIEGRYSLDVDVVYTLQTDPVSGVELATAEFAFVFLTGEDDPDPLTVDITSE